MGRPSAIVRSVARGIGSRTEAYVLSLPSVILTLGLAVYFTYRAVFW